MGRRATNTTLLRARVPQEVLAKAELLLFEPFNGERKYGAMSDLVTLLLTRWVTEQDNKRDNV